MTLENISNIKGLFEVINNCKGRVELVSEEGDCVNLKSGLAQMLCRAGVFSKGYIREMKLQTEYPEDMDLLLEFMINDQQIAR